PIVRKRPRQHPQPLKARKPQLRHWNAVVNVAGALLAGDRAQSQPVASIAGRVGHGVNRVTHPVDFPGQRMQMDLRAADRGRIDGTSVQDLHAANSSEDWTACVKPSMARSGVWQHLPWKRVQARPPGGSDALVRSGASACAARGAAESSNRSVLSQVEIMYGPAGNFPSSRAQCAGRRRVPGADTREWRETGFPTTDRTAPRR